MKNAKLFALATLVAGVVMWALAGLWHTVLMAAFYARETHAAHDGIGVIFLAYLVLAGLMTYLYQRYERGRTVRDGLMLGVVVGVLWVFPHELAMAGAHGRAISYVFQNAAWHVVEQGVGGLMIALVLSKRGARRAGINDLEPRECSSASS